MQLSHGSKIEQLYRYPIEHRTMRWYCVIVKNSGTTCAYSLPFHRTNLMLEV